MTEHKPRGHVEFRQPPGKLVADMPGDHEMRERLDEMMQNEDYSQSCAVINTRKQQEKS